MAVVDCICRNALGKETCPGDNKIVEVYWILRKYIIARTFASVADCCQEGEIASFSLAQAGATLAPEEGLQVVRFLNKEDRTGARYSFNYSWDGTRKTRNANFIAQIAGVDKDTECIADKFLGNEIAFVVKYADEQYRLINSEGGQTVNNFNLLEDGYYEVDLGGSANGLDKFIDPVWAKANIQPIADGGLVNQAA